MRRICRVRNAASVLVMLGLSACSAAGHHGTPARSSTSTTPPAPASATQLPTSRTATLSVSTDKLTAGQPVEVSGNGCPQGYWASASLLPSNPSNSPAIFSTIYSTGGDVIETGLYAKGANRVPSGPKGTWTISAVVPMVFPGPSIITARCFPLDSAARAGFLYRPRDVSVNTHYTLSVSPGTTVTPGTTLTVRSEGGGCRGVSSPFVALYQTVGMTYAVAETQSSDQLASGTNWQSQLALPSGLNAGQYQLEADCDYSRGAIYGSYAPLEITVK